MKKLSSLLMICLCLFIITGCKLNNNVELEGYYISEKTSDGYTIIMSFDKGEKIFVQYIDQREVNNGVYKELEETEEGSLGEVQTETSIETSDEAEDDKEIKIEEGDKIYRLNGENQYLEIALNKKNSFEIIIDKINEGNPIKLKNVDSVPVYYETDFDDVDKYRELLD